MNWFAPNWFTQQHFYNYWFHGVPVTTEEPGTCNDGWFGSNWFGSNAFRSNWFHGQCVEPTPVEQTSSGKNQQQMRDDFLAMENEEALILLVL